MPTDQDQGSARVEGSESLEVLSVSAIAAAREQFEADWREGRSPGIERYLHNIEPGEWNDLLRALISLEVSLREERGDHPTHQEYLERYPTWAPTIALVFKDKDAGSLVPQAVSAPPVTDRATSAARIGGTLGPIATSEDTITAYPSPGLSHAVVERASEAPLPERFGRYRTIRLLGEGGCGRVYLAKDGELGRTVAIKVPRARTLASAQQVEAFVAEARVAGSLSHKAIVKIFDIGTSEDHGSFVVMEYIEGRTMSQLLKEERPTPIQLANLMITIAEAAHHAHKAGLVHRDLKPANILLDQHGEPHIADFGLAVREDLQHLRSGEIAGTPPYMAPEQVRGEAHRLDGRTDIWALGVMLYQGLARRLPFTGRVRNEIFDEIIHRDPKPLRQVDDKIPRGLERICLKCLAKRMTDRYQSGADLAEDLKTWLVADASTDTAPPTPPPGQASPGAGGASRVVPKGLRAFDVEDADFFLTLLPGARDREGLPESVRSWKARIEERDAAKTFPVGLLYGPSGCGKSSLLKAGLLPRLNPKVHTVYVEASAGGTEARLLASLRREFPVLPENFGLAEAMAAIREGSAGREGTKVLLVLDQFEQWLHHHPEEPDAELIRALRQCDGSSLQALLLVRDDFWMAITRFFRALEVPLIEGDSSRAVELFDTQHARRVLAEIGRSLDKLSENLDSLSPDETRFLDQAIADLASSENRIIPVRLTLFAEMVRHRAWTPATLRDLGGIEGIGVTFLEETFCARSAPPSHRVHWKAAQAVLKALLPESSSNLKGNLKSTQALQEASGYAGRTAEFAELLQILDNELRMVTPVDPAGVEVEECGNEKANGDAGGKVGEDCHASAAKETHYQLTHDYLVPPLRQWLTRKQRETRRGRAELRLATITAFWKDLPERRRLPSLWEWLDILWHTRPRGWSATERRMMRSAGRHILGRAAMVLAIVAMLPFLARALSERSRSSALLGLVLKADVRHLPELLPQVTTHRDRLRADLEALEKNAEAPPRERQVAGLLLYREWPTPARAAALRDRLRVAEPDGAALIVDAFAAHPAEADRKLLRSALLDDAGDPPHRLRYACALARIAPNDAELWKAAAPALTQALLAEDRRAIPRWLALLGPAVPALVPSLGAICRDPARDAATRANAAEILADALGTRGSADSEALARLVVDTQPESARILLRELTRLARLGPALSFLQGVLSDRVDNPKDEARKDELATRQASAAVALAALGQPDALWPLLRHREDPRLRSNLIQKLAISGLGSTLLVERLRQADLDASERQAILLAWAETPPDTLSARVRSEVTESARGLYSDARSPGVHSAAELLLRRWGQADILARADEALRKRPIDTARWQWYEAPNGHTLAILPGPLEFMMGSPRQEKERESAEVLHAVKIDRTLAVGVKEVSLEQFRAFRPSYAQNQRYGRTPDCPVNSVTWFEAALYCNWLSEQAGIPREEWCYPEPENRTMRLDAGAVTRTGYRLPTEAEWEYLCRAGTVTAYPFGESTELLPHYGWTWLNSDDRTLPTGRLLPNEFGLFDVQGNMWEWCHDGPATGRESYPSYPPSSAAHPAGDTTSDQTLTWQSTGNLSRRLARGGAYSYAPSSSRSAKRYIAVITLQHPYMGFRVVRTMPGTASTAADTAAR